MHPLKRHIKEFKHAYLFLLFFVATYLTNKYFPFSVGVHAFENKIGFSWLAVPFALGMIFCTFKLFKNK